MRRMFSDSQGGSTEGEVMMYTIVLLLYCVIGRSSRHLTVRPSDKLLSSVFWRMKLRRFDARKLLSRICEIKCENFIDRPHAVGIDFISRADEPCRTTDH